MAVLSNFRGRASFQLRVAALMLASTALWGPAGTASASAPVTASAAKSPSAANGMAAASAHAAMPPASASQSSSQSSSPPASQAVSATAWSGLDLKQSSIHITFNKMKVPVSGFFKSFSGELVFDPERPAAGHANLEVEVDSLSLRDAKLSRELRGADWLDVEQFPVARFVSSAIVTAGDDKYSVAGKLTLRGKTLNVVVPVSYTQAGQAQVFDGMLPIRREQFGVGPQSSLLADKVVLTLHLVSLPRS